MGQYFETAEDRDRWMREHRYGKLVDVKPDAEESSQKKDRSTSDPRDISPDKPWVIR